LQYKSKYSHDLLIIKLVHNRVHRQVNSSTHTAAAAIIAAAADVEGITLRRGYNRKVVVVQVGLIWVSIVADS